MSHTHAPDTAQAIKDRALTLYYEGRKFPRTAKMAASWMINAAEWARRHGDFDLAAHLVTRAVSLDLYALYPTPLQGDRPGRWRHTPTLHDRREMAQ